MKQHKRKVNTKDELADKILDLYFVHDIKQTNLYIEFLNQQIQFYRSQIDFLESTKPFRLQRKKFKEYSRKVEELNQKIMNCYRKINEEVEIVLEIKQKVGNRSKESE